MANVFNTLLATTFANSQEERRRAQERSDLAGNQLSEAVSQNLALRKQQEDERKAQAQKIGAASQLTGEKGQWDYDSPELRGQGEVGALGERADIQKQQIAAQINAQKLQEIIEGKYGVANIAAGAGVKKAEIGAGAKTSAAEIGAGAKTESTNTMAEALKYGADARSNAAIEAARLRAQATSNLPALRAFWTSKRAWDTGPQGQQVTALNTGIQHLSRFLDSVDQLRNQKVLQYNRLTNKYDFETGDPRVVKMATDAHFVGNEVGRLMQGAGSLTDQEKGALHSILDVNGSPEQQEAAATELWQLMTGRVSSMMSQRENMFRSPEDYQFLSPESESTIHARGLPMPTGGGKPKPTASPTAPARVKFRMPDGRTGTADQGDKLPDGAQVVQ